MNRLPRFCMNVMALLLLAGGHGSPGYGLEQDSARIARPGEVFVIQIAASKVYVDPDVFRQQFKLTDSVRYFRTHNWYRYFIGSYTTENEAIQVLTDLKIEAFVTPVPDTLVAVKTIPAPVPDSLAEISDARFQRLYNLKIREADSAFNIARDLLLARELYQEAELFSQGRNYPADQIVEIDKQLEQKQSQTFFSTWRIWVIILAGLALVAGILLLVRRAFRSQGRKGTLITKVEPPVDTSLLPKPYDRLDSDDYKVRTEAELALMGLDPADPCAFLDRLTKPFSNWEQLNVYGWLKRNPSRIPEFIRWIDNGDETVVLFAVRMIRIFKQGGAFTYLVPLLSHGNPGIREEVICALGESGREEALVILRSRFAKEGAPGKKLILKAISYIPDESNMEFLKGIVWNEPEFREEAMMALARIPSFGASGVEGLPAVTDAERDRIATAIFAPGNPL